MDMEVHCSDLSWRKNFVIVFLMPCVDSLLLSASSGFVSPAEGLFTQRCAISESANIQCLITAGYKRQASLAAMGSFWLVICAVYWLDFSQWAYIALQLLPLTPPHPFHRGSFLMNILHIKLIFIICFQRTQPAKGSAGSGPTVQAIWWGLGDALLAIWLAARALSQVVGGAQITCGTRWQVPVMN